MNINEAKCYNALNLIYIGSYSKLQKAITKHGAWAKALKSEKTKLDPEKEWENLSKLEISLILKEDPCYPELLKEAPLSPFGIYSLGNLNYSKPAVAIVGTRAATPQGKELAGIFSQKLAESGIPIISGLAMGVDEFAHKGALEGNGKTIAVLGTPLDHLYPKQNEKLAKDILKNNGAIISEFPLRYEYHPANFLIRNRIISGLSNAILVIEAPEKSGSLATARFALEQNREVFVIPGNISALNYKGSNALIKAGATPVTEPQDILDYFGIKESKEKTFPANSGNKEEKEIIDALDKDSGLTIEQLLKKTSSELNNLNKNLAMLVIKGIIKESNGKYHI